MKLRCLLVDDEPPALRVLSMHIAQVPGMEIVGRCQNALEAMNILHEKTIDLLFLDIKMPKITGTDFLRNLPNPPLVIFVTAYRDFALEGYELDAVDYLVKPVSFERFLKAVNKVKRLAGIDHAHEPEVVKEKPNDSFIYLKVDKNMQKIHVDEILYVESWKDYVRVYLQEGKQLLVKQSISAMENMLSGHKFIRAHRSYIIPTAKITGYNAMQVLVNDLPIPIGRLYKQSVMDLFRHD